MEVEEIFDHQFLQITLLLSIRHLALGYGAYIMIRRGIYALNLGNQHRSDNHKRSLSGLQ